MINIILSIYQYFSKIITKQRFTFIDYSICMQLGKHFLINLFPRFFGIGIIGVGNF
jgi:hypothetical protein